MKHPRDSRDTFVNGFLTGLAIPIIFFFLLQGLGKLLATYVVKDWIGFSLRFTCVMSIVANVIPFQVFTRQLRSYAMRGVVTATLVLLFALLIYFWNSFMN